MDTQNTNQDQAEMMEPKWDKLKEYMENKTVLEVTVDGVVNGGLVSNIEGVRGFIPASQVALKFVEDLNDYLLQEIKVQVIEVDEKANRLVLSARDVLREEAKAKKRGKNQLAFFSETTDEDKLEAEESSKPKTIDSDED